MNNHTLNPSNFKLSSASRYQYEFLSRCLDELVSLDHKVRLIWDFVASMDLSSALKDISSLYKNAGRPAVDPKITLTLWIYTIIDGNCSARKLAELCQNHDVYKWICGGVQVNRTSLAEFRSLNPRKFDDLLTACLAVMIKNGLIADTDFSQDGTRIKADAGYNSFRREASLKDLEIQVSNYIEELRKEEKATLNMYERRKLEQKERHAIEKQNRIKEALKSLEEFRSEKVINAKRNNHKVTDKDLNEARVSTTDPQSRKMKMGDGGYRLAYNIQFATGLDSRLIYGVDAVNTLDPGTAPRMMAQIQERLKALNLSEIKKWIGDAAYSAKNDIKNAALLFPNCLYYAPPKVNSKKIDPKKYLKTDCEAIKKWKDSIGSEEVGELYKKRCSTAEFSNMQVKNHGLTAFSVRGLIKVKGMALLHAISMNLLRFFDLTKQKEGEKK